jgi:hypothetical protein
LRRNYRNNKFFVCRRFVFIIGKWGNPYRVTKSCLMRTA